MHISLRRLCEFGPGHAKAREAAREEVCASRVCHLWRQSSIAPGRPAPAPSASIRSDPRVLRLWIAPWEDADGDLHEEALVHVVVDTGRWLIEHVRPVSRSRVDGVAPPVSPVAQEPTPAKAPTETSQAPTRFPLPPAGLSSGSETAPVER